MLGFFFLLAGGFEPAPLLTAGGKTEFSKIAVLILTGAGVFPKIRGYWIKKHPRGLFLPVRRPLPPDPLSQFVIRSLFVRFRGVESSLLMYLGVALAA